MTAAKTNRLDYVTIKRFLLRYIVSLFTLERFFSRLGNVFVNVLVNIIFTDIVTCICTLFIFPTLLYVTVTISTKYVFRKFQNTIGE